MKDPEFIDIVKSVASSGEYGSDDTVSADSINRGIRQALRIILRCREGESILERAATVMRRADRLAEKYPEFGPI
jgi:hypothetical protein